MDIEKQRRWGSSETVARYELQGKRWRPRGGRELGMNMESNIYKTARMNRWLAVLGIAVVVVLAAGCDLFREAAEPEGPTPYFPPTQTPMPAQTTGALTPTQTAFEEINFTNVTTLTGLPSQVQVVFSLRDQNGHSIVLPAEEIKNAARVYERGETDDDWEEIDYSETSFFVHTAENFQLEVVFVLDFTNSMAQATLPDGGSGIDAMMSAFESAALSPRDSQNRRGRVPR